MKLGMTVLARNSSNLLDLGWTDRHVLSSDFLTVSAEYVSSILKLDGNRYSFRNGVFFRILDDRKMPETR
jgi:hypothetical protein